jgi:hypothetical protein
MQNDEIKRALNFNTIVSVISILVTLAGIVLMVVSMM